MIPRPSTHAATYADEFVTDSESRMNPRDHRSRYHLVLDVSDVVRVRDASVPAQIRRSSRQRQFTVYANTTNDASEQAIIESMTDEANKLGMEPGYGGAPAGRAREMEKAVDGFLLAIVLSLVFMSLVLAAKFESFVHPLSICRRAHETVEI